MRYVGLGGAVRVTGPGTRHPIASRAWLTQVAADGARRSAVWAQRAVTRRGALALMAGAILIGAAAGSRDARLQTAQVSPAARAVVLRGDQAVETPALSPGAVIAPAASPVSRPAQNAITGLKRPGYALGSSAVQALQNVGVTVADAAEMQQLRTQILAPAAQTGLSGTALNDLVSLVRQAQLASASASQSAGPAIDPVQLAQAQTNVKTAQQKLLDATKARDQALLPGSGDAPSTATAVAATAGSSPGSVAPGSPTTANPAVVHDAQARLDAAQAALKALLVAPPVQQVRAAQDALDSALSQTPAAPSPDQLAAAKAAVDSAQKAYDAVGQGPSTAGLSVAESRAQGRATPPTGSIQTGRTIPVADPAAKAPDPGAVNNPTLNAQQIADTQANLDTAKAALAALEQQAAMAENPESQPAVIQARKHLADLTVGPDPKAVADAQAIVVATQGQLNALLGKPATPTAGTGASAALSTTGANSGAAAASSSTDPVAAAEHGLTDAQKALHDLISPGSTGSVQDSGAQDIAAQVVGAGSSTSLPAGSTMTQVTPQIQSAESGISFGEGVSRNDLSAVEVELRARYVVVSALTSAHLHPSALAPSASAQLARTGALASRAFTWPVVGVITQPFGVPELGVGAPHTGLDIGVDVATPVLASASGVVNFAGGDPSTGYGYYAIVDNGGGVSTLYGHLALPPFLHPGQFLAQGGLIGLSGSTGFSTGPHVHFEVRLNGVPVDPQRVLPSSLAR